MRRLSIVGILVAMTAPAAGHELAYIGHIDQSRDVGYVDLECQTPMFQTATTALDDQAATFGGVCFPDGHIQPIAEGESGTLTVDDDFLHPVSAFYCQDNDGDGFCGNDDDNAMPFCGSLYIHALPSGTDPPEPPNWEPSIAVQVYIDGPFNGGLGPCGGGFGTSGAVHHSGPAA